MTHRGPDDSGIWWDADLRVGLAHRRLAVIDLTSAGRQPMTDNAGSLRLIFNGEIYNYLELRRELEERGHLFRTASDSEVILEAYREWGTDCLKRFNGMYAFGLFDQTSRRLFLARDRVGEKPLFYRHDRGVLTFASELKAILEDPASPRRLNPLGLHHYLAFGYVPEALCLVDGISKLPPGCALTYDQRSTALEIWRYWTFPGIAPLPHPRQSGPNESELVNELEGLLFDSVRLRLIADVPVGILLSGGVDSSLVTAAAARVSRRPVKTFTISFPGHAGFDEAPHARLVADAFGTQHAELIAEPATVDLIPLLARQFDEPIADSSMVPTYMVSRLIKEQATVALGGDGGDELFGGYPHHSWVQTQTAIGAVLPDGVRDAARTACLHLLPLGMRGRNYLIETLSKPAERLTQYNVYFDALSRHAILCDQWRNHAGATPEVFRRSLVTADDSPLRQITALDFQTYLPDDILVKVDRASMLASLEVRAPWLDPRLVDFAFAKVPDSLRATPRARKIILRKLAKRLLPASFDVKRKQGFSLPLQAWLRGEWGTFAEDVLREADPGVFRRSAIAALIKGQRRGRSNSHRIYSLTMFELWRRHYNISS